MRANEFLSKGWSRLCKLFDFDRYIDVDSAFGSIREDVAFRGPNIVILFCAIIIASLGLNVNSIPVIIGAMLISPLMPPILGFGLALGTNDTGLLRYSLKNLGIMVGISILSSTLFFLLSPLDLEHPTELLARTNPTIYDVLIALFGGFAGIVEVSRKKQGTVMSGVAIATALMPPLCTVGYGIASWQWKYAIGAFYLFFINCIFIALAAYAGTKFLGYRLVHAGDPKVQRRRKTFITLILIVMLIPSFISGYRVIRENSVSRDVSAFVSDNKNVGRSYIYDYRLHIDEHPASVELFIAGEELNADEYELLYRSAEAHNLTRAQLVFRQDAAHNSSQLSDRDIVQEILRSNDEKLKSVNAENEQLRQQVTSLLAQLEEHNLPASQMADELSTQYPCLRDIKVGRMASGGVMMVVYTDPKHPLSREQLASLEAWAKARLQTDEAIVVQK